MHQPRVHHHPRNASREIYGQRLEPGDLIEAGDVHDCTSGVWRPCHMESYGTPVLPGSEVVIIRPQPVMIFGQPSVTA